MGGRHLKGERTQPSMFSRSEQYEVNGQLTFEAKDWLTDEDDAFSQDGSWLSSGGEGSDTGLDYSRDNEY